MIVPVELNIGVPGEYVTEATDGVNVIVPLKETVGVALLYVIVAALGRKSVTIGVPIA